MVIIEDWLWISQCDGLYTKIYKNVEHKWKCPLNFHFGFFGAPWAEDSLSTISTTDIERERLNQQRQELAEERARICEEREELNRQTQQFNEEREELNRQTQQFNEERAAFFALQRRFDQHGNTTFQSIADIAIASDNIARSITEMRAAVETARRSEPPADVESNLWHFHVSKFVFLEKRNKWLVQSSVHKKIY